MITRRQLVQSAALFAASATMANAWTPARTQIQLFLLDAGHAYRGGADVPAFLRKHHDRIFALHLRDYNNGQQVPLGQRNVSAGRGRRDVEASKLTGLGTQRGRA
jgi:hypothetical protein